MPTQAVQTEEENLIILDDIVEEDTSPEIKIEEPIPSEDIIDFGSDTTDNSFDLGNIETNEIKTEEKDTNISSDLNLGDLNLEDNNTSIEVNTPDLLEDNDTSTAVMEKTEDDIDFGGDFSLDSSTEELGNNSEELLGSTEKEDSSDLNSILDGTIIQLQSRSDIISEDKEVEQGNIKDYKSQIAILEDNVTNSEGIVANLNKEAAKIRSNIKSLERMKMKDEVEEVKKQTSAKVHNSKRSR